MAVIPLSRVRSHFAEQRASTTGIGIEAPTDVRDTIQDQFAAFTQDVRRTRQGTHEDRSGHRIPAYDVSLEEAANEFFGSTTSQLLRSMGIYSGSDSLFSIASRLGFSNLTSGNVADLMQAHTSYGNVPNNTSTNEAAYRFLIPELIMNAVRTGYQGTSLHQNWITGTTPISQLEVTMPQILRGNAMPSRVNEGANIPMGSLRFGQKKASVYKIGTGFSITDELVLTSQLDLLFQYMQEVGSDMSIGTDVAAMRVLLNGEQLDGSESAPVVGVKEIGKAQFTDLQKVFTRLSRLGTGATRLIAGEDDGIEITNIDKFQGFQGGSKLADLRTILGVPNTFNLDTFVLPPAQMLFLNPTRAMTKLQFRGLQVEKRRNPQNQTEETFVSDYLDFAIIKRDARVILDKSITYASSPFPAYMDIDSRISETFQDA